MMGEKAKLKEPAMRPGLTYKFKVLVLGNSTQEKDHLCRIGDHFFREEYQETIGVAFRRQELASSWGEQVVLQLWVIADDPIFENIFEYFSKGSHGAIVCVDVARRQSLKNAAYWIQRVRTFRPNIPILLLGCWRSAQKHLKWIRERKVQSLGMKYGNLPFCIADVTTTKDISPEILGGFSELMVEQVPHW
jgi:hypothetical protein